MEIALNRQQKFQVEDSSHIGEIRRAMNHWASDLGLTPTVAGQIAIVINELGTNILKHATRGEIICTLNQNSLSILALDKGPGISNISAALKDGFSTHGTAGNGLGAIKRLSTEFDLFTEANKGTIVLSRFTKSSEQLNHFYECHGFSLPLKGEIVSGDGWIDVSEIPHKILVSDGLGHGTQAHAASLQAITTFVASSHTNPLNDVNALHLALRSTRGAAVAVAYVNQEKQIIDYCGLGNIVGTIVSKNISRKLVSYNGTAGLQLRKTQVLPYPYESDSLLVMHSDGLSSHWNISDYPGLFIKDTLIIAGLLYRDFCRGNDDVTVIVGRQKE
jgi:anti-sigma regulatory factor (Ser/Thr protein kinase)